MHLNKESDGNETKRKYRESANSKLFLAPKWRFAILIQLLLLCRTWINKNNNKDNDNTLNSATSSAFSYCYAPTM